MRRLYEAARRQAGEETRCEGLLVFKAHPVKHLFQPTLILKPSGCFTFTHVSRQSVSN